MITVSFINGPFSSHAKESPHLHVVRATSPTLMGLGVSLLHPTTHRDLSEAPVTTAGLFVSSSCLIYRCLARVVRLGSCTFS